ncbi:Prolyl 4-hydroxylase subunit alpha-1 [Globisporangium polare]
MATATAKASKAGATATAGASKSTEEEMASANGSGGGSLLATALAALLGALLLGVSFQQPERVRLATSRALQLVAPHFGLSVAGLSGGDGVLTGSSSRGGSSGGMGEALARSVDCKDALQYLTEAGPVKGFHVVCIRSTPLDSLWITGFKDGMQPNVTLETAIDTTVVKTQLESMFGIRANPEDEYEIKYKQPYALFTPEGERLESRLSSIVNRVVFLFEGGQFIWPGVKIGHKTVVKNVYGKGDVVLETLSMTPLVFGVDEFLKDNEIDVIMDLSLEHLKPSGVMHNDNDKGRPATDWRTSTTYFLPSSSHPLMADIDRRTADLVKVPQSHQEYVQVLRYEPTQKYDHHLDFFSVANHQQSPHVLESIEYGHKNRMITVFWYMSDVPKGGHTIFPRAGGLPPPASMKDCSKGLKVPPRKRKVIVFYSMLPNGEGDPLSLHGGCPVEEGTKYSGNKWVWNKPRANP